jgi:organic radical activating enzyme
LVITGGEPLLQQDQLCSLVEALPQWVIEVETNGTIKPKPVLAERCHFNVSPKLTHSGVSLPRRIKPGVLVFFNKATSSCFKFVVESPKDFLEIDQLVSEYSLAPEKVVIMAEGTTSLSLRRRAVLLIEEVKKRGWRFLPRLHIDLWGKRRAI